jgi:hypothetical protein
MNVQCYQVHCETLEIQSLSARCQQLYIALCAHSAPYAIHLAHDGAEVEFWSDRFGHAFKSSANGKKVVDDIDLRRVMRMQWILPVIRGAVPGVRCLELPPDQKYRPPRDARNRRLYTLEAERYVVWLQPKSDHATHYKFSSAYPCTPDQLAGYVAAAVAELQV